jgi:hypothetical protein
MIKDAPPQTKIAALKGGGRWGVSSWWIRRAVEPRTQPWENISARSYGPFLAIYSVSQL